MRIGAYLLATLFLGTSLACSMGGDSDKSEWSGRGRGAGIERATVVEVHSVALGSVGDRLASSAVVESEAMADLFPATSGIVKSVLKEEGDAVSEGEVLAIIDSAAATAGSARSRADVERLQADVTRLETLAAQGAVSSREVEEARYSLRTARTAAWESGAVVGQTRIKSPINGVVAVRDLRVGELANSGARAFQVVDLHKLRVVASLPERDLPRVAIGQPVTLVSAYDPDVFTVGTVARVSPVVDPSSGTFRVTVDLSQDQTVLRPGQFVSVEIEVDRHDNVRVVPRVAVVYEDGVAVVYRMIDKPEDEGTDTDTNTDTTADADSDTSQPAGPKYVADRVVVQVGLSDASWTEIHDGVDIGDRVVVVGQSNLRDGAPIRAPQAPEATHSEDEG